MSRLVVTPQGERICEECLVQIAERSPPEARQQVLEELDGEEVAAGECAACGRRVGFAETEAERQEDDA